MPEQLTTLAENALAALPNVLTALLIFALGYYAGVWLSRLLKRILQRNHAEPGVSHLLSQILKWTIISLGAVTALQRFFNVAAFLAGLGVIGFIIGFALQNIVQNFVSGVILLVQQPFKAGHSVSIAGFDGVVLKIGLRATELQALDGRIVFLPNADVVAQPIVNYTRANARRVEIPLGLAHDSNLGMARKVILDQLKTIPGFIPVPEPQVLFQNFSDSAMDLNVLFWVDTIVIAAPAARDEALTRIKESFEKNRIEISRHVQVQVEAAPKARPKRKTK
jgi:small-conductance mechanosensitive channel